jgi:DNA-binding response OmpR family regulator
VVRALQILLVDDESDLLDMLTTALTMRGYEVDPVQTGADALDRARALDYDGIVLDINLLGAMNGRELYMRIVAEKPEMAKRVIFITADTLNFETHRFLETVDCPSLEKPFLISDFLAAMELLVKKPFLAQHSPLNT